MTDSQWHIYLEKIPYSESSSEMWVSFESDPRLKKTKKDIYGRCLPCIQDLYYQLKKGRDEIRLGPALNCWKVTTVVRGLEEALELLMELEQGRPLKYVRGKLGSGRTGASTKVVVFHAESVEERDLIRKALDRYRWKSGKVIEIFMSRGCASLHGEVLGDWQEWGPKTRIKHPDKVASLLERIQKVLYWK